MRKTLCLAGFASAVLFVSNGFTQSPTPPKPEPLTLPPAAAPIPAAYYPPQAVTVPTVLPVAMDWTPVPAAAAVPTPLMTKVIDIADVILPPGADGSKAACVDRAERLSNLLEGFVAPRSWTGAGGRGSMVYFATNHTLVVNNEETIVRDVATWIDRLRDASTPTVWVSIEHVRCTQGTLAKLGFDAKTGCLTPAQRVQAMKSLEADPRFEVLVSPKLAIRDNRTGHVQIGGRVMPTAQQATATAPFVGTTFRATPRVAPDGKTIQVRVESEWSEPDPTKLSDARYTILKSAASMFVVPSGGTAILPMGYQTVPTTTEWKVPVLGDLPVGDVLFRGRSTESTDCELFLFVTASPLTNPGAAPMPPVEVKPMPTATAVRYIAPLAPPAPARTACEWVADYRKACAEGRTDDAKRCAIQALALDPKCFTEK